MIVDRHDSSTAARSLQQWPLLIVVAGVVLGLAIAAFGEGTWRIGCVVVGSSLIVGALETVRVAAVEVAEPTVLVNTAR